MSYDIINYLRKVNAEQAIIDRLITKIQQSHPEIKGDPKTVKKIIAGNVRRKTLGVVIGAYNLNPTYVRGLEQGRYMKNIPLIVKSYPLIHTITGTEVMEGIAGSKFGCGAINDGTKHIETADDPMIDIGTGAFSISFLYKSTSSASDHGIVCKKDVTANNNAGFEVYVSTTSNIRCRIADGSSNAFLDVSAAGIKNGNWHSIVVNIPTGAGNIEAFMDDSSLGTVSRSSVGSVNNALSLYEMARYDGTVINKLNGSIALFSLVLNTLDSAARTDYSNGIIDTTNEGIFRPYCANWVAEPNMTSGLFQSGT